MKNLYNYLNNENGTRVCEGITDDACEHVAKNYFLIIFSNVFTKLGDTLSNPKTVLTWLMSYVNAPVYLISLIVPIRESGSMLPQILLSQYVSQKPIRKWIWVVGSFLQFLSVASMGFIALKYKGVQAGGLIIVAVILFSLSGSICSISSKDVLGKSIPKTGRGRLKGYTASVSGLLVLAVGLFLLYKSKTEATIAFYSTLIFFAAAMWFIAAIIYSRIKEFPGEVVVPDKDTPTLSSKINLLKKDKPFRDFVVARSLLLCSALTAPYYILLAQNNIGKDTYLLGLFIIANGVASIISAPIWGKFSDKSSKNVMAIAVLIASFLGIITFLIITYSNTIKHILWIYPVAFFILGIAHGGVRLGRKTYIVDMATGNKRTDYVAISNTTIGLILLVTGGLSALVSLISIEGVILTLSLFGLLGAYKSYKLPNVE
ncbi:MFS transporter [Lacinutrix neustonica]|uniref:MFS transporter n=1 Tax=Lacinutrix neustonica TaxID=2980107 RepID=A0A9E8SF69_9FLAO|nr:MFS transporter [Lacinutrix neustonica]WAC03512.1 MFS transporter [Lacinutrix neustonica]